MACQTIILANDGILSIRLLGTNFGEISMEIHIFSLKTHLKLSSGNWRPFGIGLNELIIVWMSLNQYQLNQFFPRPEMERFSTTYIISSKIWFSYYTLWVVIYFYLIIRHGSFWTCQWTYNVKHIFRKEISWRIGTWSHPPCGCNRYWFIWLLHNNGKRMTNRYFLTPNDTSGEIFGSLIWMKITNGRMSISSIKLIFNLNEHTNTNNSRVCCGLEYRPITLRK